MLHRLSMPKVDTDKCRYLISFVVLLKLGRTRKKRREDPREDYVSVIFDFVLDSER